MLGRVYISYKHKWGFRTILKRKEELAKIKGKIISKNDEEHGNYRNV